jgi:AraC-like DNA-binding protein
MKALIKPFCSQLDLQDGIISLFYSSHVTPMHRHNVLQLILDLKNEFLFRTDHTYWTKYQCLVVKEGVNHQLATNNSLQLILYLDDINPMTKHIREKYLVHNDFYQLDISLSVSEEILLLQKLLNPDNVSFISFAQSFLNRLIDVKDEHLNDNRIATVLQFVRKAPVCDLSIEYLSNKICMSSSRLRAIFRTCMGFPLHQYILRYKILTAINEIVNGRTIQDAVYCAGFNDSSHFNKMLKKIFKVKPSQFLKNNLCQSRDNKTKLFFKTELA